MWWVPLAAAAISAISAERSNSARRDEAKRQMEFQEQQTSSAYQRSMQDMRTAGLNPMLAGKLGGAQSGSGAQAAVEDVGAAASGSAAQAMGVIQGFQQVKQSDAQIELAKAQAAKVKSETFDQQLNSAHKAQQISSLFQSQLTEAQRADLVRNQADLTKVLQNLREVELDVNQTSFSADVARRKAESSSAVLGLDKAKAESKFYGSDLGQLNPTVRMILEVLRGVTSAASARR